MEREFGRMCASKKLKVNVGKGKVLRFSFRVRLRSEELKEISKLKYLGSIMLDC